MSAMKLLLTYIMVVLSWARANQLHKKLDRESVVEMKEGGFVELSQAGNGHEACLEAANLGPSLSKSRGFHYPFPLLGSTDLSSPRGRESEIGFLVGGSYFAPVAEGIEGNIVVLGDFKIGSLGTNSLGTFWFEVHFFVSFVLLEANLVSLHVNVPSRMDWIRKWYFS
jgi:hypothetical protein